MINKKLLKVFDDEYQILKIPCNWCISNFAILQSAVVSFHI